MNTCGIHLPGPGLRLPLDLTSLFLAQPSSPSTSQPGPAVLLCLLLGRLTGSIIGCTMTNTAGGAGTAEKHLPIVDTGDRGRGAAGLAPLRLSLSSSLCVLPWLCLCVFVS